MSDRRMPADPGIRAWAWRWGPDEERRPGLPWIGVFLVVFGALLLVERMLPDQRLGDVAVLAAGLASLVVWIVRRSTMPPPVAEFGSNAPTNRLTSRRMLRRR